MQGIAWAIFIVMMSRAVAQDPGVLLREGRDLDLEGKYGEARADFLKVLEMAGTGELQVQARRSLAVSYGFEGDCRNAEKYEGPLYSAYLEQKNYFQAGEMADELARICIDAGDLDQAFVWYQKGHDAGMNETEEKQKDLWNFRWEHAQARIAARRGIQEKRASMWMRRRRFWIREAIRNRRPSFRIWLGMSRFMAAITKPRSVSF